MEQYVRRDRSHWTYREHHSLQDVVRLETIDCDLDLASVYLKVDLD